MIFDAPVAIDEWAQFCEKNLITFSPNTVGQNTFYSQSGTGQVEISLNEEGSVDKTATGYRWETARPPLQFTGLTVSSYHGCNYAEIGNIARNIASVFPCLVSSSPELAHEIVDLDHKFDITDYDDCYLSTDFPEAWTRVGDTMTARVDGGLAKLDLGEKVVFSLYGIKRATFRDVNTAIAYAGRCNWDWWYGDRP
jgi:hypothetical protein